MNFCGIVATIRTRREIQCLPYEGLHNKIIHFHFKSWNPFRVNCALAVYCTILHFISTPATQPKWLSFLVNLMH